MSFYRKYEDSDGPDPALFKKLGISSFEDLPQEAYEELISRTMSMAQRMNDRTGKLQGVLQKLLDPEGEVAPEEAYWRTAITEQVAFLEMQLSKLHEAIIILAQEEQ